MKSPFSFKGICVMVITLSSLACKKDKPVKYPPRKIRYEVAGSNMRLNFIDSQMVWQENQLHSSSFVYEFSKPPGTNIGISIYKQATTDTIWSWRLTIDGKLFANGFSEGGVYMPVPYY